MIEIKNVTKTYGKFTAVDDISFEVKDGEILGLLGPNGAGKSTTMNMITGYIEPTQGTIIINGYDILRKPKKAKKQIGYMPENVPLYNELTPREFLKYMAELKLVNKKERKDEIQRVINETGLDEVENKLIKNLSRGYKQRVSMAGSLIGNPDVVILDEPTVGLDPKQISEIRNNIKKLGKKHTVILSSHILSEVSQICDRVVIINNGKIVAIDTPEKLEKATKNKNIIYITIEDKKEKMTSIKGKIKDIEELSFVKNMDDGAKQYKIVSDEKVDLRKKLFEVLPKEDITILELKKEEASLEDAFLKLIKEDVKAEPEAKNETENKAKKVEEKAEEKKEKKTTKKVEKENEEKKVEKKSKEKTENKKDNKKEDKKDKGGKK